MKERLSSMESESLTFILNCDEIKNSEGDSGILAGCCICSLSMCSVSLHQHSDCTLSKLVSQITFLLICALLTFSNTVPGRTVEPPPLTPQHMRSSSYLFQEKKTGHNSSVGSWFGRRLVTLSTMPPNKQWASQ